jgi:hypothetical protein
LHAVDDLDRFFYCHFARISLTHCRLERAESEADAERLRSQKENEIEWPTGPNFWEIRITIQGKGGIV